MAEFFNAVFVRFCVGLRWFALLFFVVAVVFFTLLALSLFLFLFA